MEDETQEQLQWSDNSLSRRTKVTVSYKEVDEEEFEEQESILLPEARPPPVLKYEYEDAAPLYPLPHYSRQGPPPPGDFEIKAEEIPETLDDEA